MIGEEKDGRQQQIAGSLGREEGKQLELARMLTEGEMRKDGAGGSQGLGGQFCSLGGRDGAGGDWHGRGGGGRGGRMAQKVGGRLEEGSVPTNVGRRYRECSR